MTRTEPSVAGTSISGALAQGAQIDALAAGDADEATAAGAERGQKRDKALVRAAGATLLARLVTTFSVVVILAIAARSLNGAEFGIIGVLTTLTAFLGFGDFGLGTLLMTRLPAVRAKGDVDEERHIVTLSFGTMCITGGIIGAAGAVSSYFVPWPTLLGATPALAADVRSAVLCFFIFGGLSIPAALGGRILAATLRGAAAQMWLALGSALSMVATGVCAAGHMPMWAYIIAISGVPAATSAVQTVWAFARTFPELRPSRSFFHFREALTYLRSGLLFAIMSLSSVISYSIDSLVVSANLTAAIAAVFVVASRLFTLVGGTIGLAGQQLWSALSDAIARGDAHWARSRFYRTLGISTAVTFGASLLLVFIGRPIVHLWAGEKYVPPLSLLIVMAIYTVYSTAMVQAGYLLAAVEKVGVLATCGVLMAVVNLATSIWLTRRYGLTGPILGSIIALALVLTVPVIYLLVGEVRSLDRQIAGLSPSERPKHRYRPPRPWRH
jgi:O-antigen/teichoic acid export membrane protein